MHRNGHGIFGGTISAVSKWIKQNRTGKNIASLQAENSTFYIESFIYEVRRAERTQFGLRPPLCN
jgi:hypothetical protein